MLAAAPAGAQQITGSLSSGEFDGNDLAWRLFAQTTVAPTTAGTTATEHEDSASELNRKLTNPVSDIWSLANQFNKFKLENGHWNNNWNFQPVLPVSLTKDVNLVTRLVMPFFDIVPRRDRPQPVERTAGLGDLTVLGLLSPANSGNWLLGVGPTFIFPTANSKFTGQGKYQAWPGVVVGYLTKEYILGVFPQQWFSIGGGSGRPDTSQLNLQPIAAIFLEDGWSIGYSGNILADWKASHGNGSVCAKACTPRARTTASPRASERGCVTRDLISSSSLRHPHEDDLEALPHGRLEIRAGELVALPIVGQRVCAAGIAGGAELDEDLHRRCVTCGFGPGDVDRPGIEIHRIDRAAGLGAADVQEVAAVRPKPAAVQPPKTGVCREGGRRRLRPLAGREPGKRARGPELPRAESDDGGGNRDRQGERHGHDRCSPLA
jgi:hypothetical protein